MDGMGPATKFLSTINKIEFTPRKAGLPVARNLGTCRFHYYRPRYGVARMWRANLGRVRVVARAPTIWNLWPPVISFARALDVLWHIRAHVGCDEVNHTK